MKVCVDITIFHFRFKGVLTVMKLPKPADISVMSLGRGRVTSGATCGRAHLVGNLLHTFPMQTLQI